MAMDLDEYNNRIKIGVTDKKYISQIETALDQFPVPRQAVGIEVMGKVIIDSKPSNQQKYLPNTNKLQSYQTLRDKVRPLTGGLDIDVYSGRELSNCSMGIIAKWGSTDVMITAGHCTYKTGELNKDAVGQSSLCDIVGEEIFDPDFNVDSQGRRFRYSDAEIFRLTTNEFAFGTVALTNGRSQTWGENPDYQSQIRETPSRLTYVDEIEPLINMPVVKTGSETGSTIGYIENTCINITTQEPTPEGYPFWYCQSSASPLYNKRGDSGGPVITDYVDGIEMGEAFLVGLHVGKIGDETDGSGKGFFSPLSGLRTDLNTSLRKLSFIPVNGNIFGPNSINDTGTYTYQFELNNSVGTVSYQWDIQWEGSSIWNSLGTSSSQSVSISDNTNFTIRMTVNDDVGTKIDHFPVTVNVSSGDCSELEPCFNDGF